jgi:TonB family protein
MRFVLIVVFALTASIAVPNADAQLPQLDPLAAQMAHAIGHSKQKSVVVFDFWGPDKKLNALGQYMAQNFSLELSNPPEPFSVLDRSKIIDACAKYDFSTAALGDPATSLWLANGIEAKAAILGKLAILDGQLMIEVTSYKTQDGKKIAGFKARIALSDDMRALMDQVIPNIPPGEFAKAKFPGKNGYTFPKCLHCPPAPYDPKAADKYLQGTVTLIAIVGADGNAHDMFVISALPNGLTQNAVDTVKTWKFQPALGPDGQPAAVWQTIEVTFHLY